MYVLRNTAYTCSGCLIPLGLRLGSPIVVCQSMRWYTRQRQTILRVLDTAKVAAGAEVRSSASQGIAPPSDVDIDSILLHSDVSSGTVQHSGITTVSIALPVVMSHTVELIASTPPVLTR